MKTKVWVRVGNTNNFTVLDFFKELYKMFFCIFVVFGLEIYSKRAILVPKSAFQSPKRIFQVAKQNPWPEGRYGELEVRNGTKPYQRDELHPKTVFKNFKTEF